MLFMGMNMMTEFATVAPDIMPCCGAFIGDMIGCLLCVFNFFCSCTSQRMAARRPITHARMLCPTRWPRRHWFGQFCGAAEETLVRTVLWYTHAPGRYVPVATHGPTTPPPLTQAYNLVMPAHHTIGTRRRFGQSVSPVVPRMPRPRQVRSG